MCYILSINPFNQSSYSCYILYTLRTANCILCMHLQGVNSMAHVNVRVNLDVLTSLQSTVLKKAMPIKKPSGHGSLLEEVCKSANNMDNT